MPDRRWHLTSWRRFFSLVLIQFPILFSVIFSTYRMAVPSAGIEVEKDGTVSIKARRRRFCTTKLPPSRLSCHTLIPCAYMFRCQWPWRCNVAHRHFVPDKHAICAHIGRKPASSQSHCHRIFEQLGRDAPTADLALELLCAHSCVLGWQREIESRKL